MVPTALPHSAQWQFPCHRARAKTLSVFEDFLSSDPFAIARCWSSRNIPRPKRDGIVHSMSFAPQYFVPSNRFDQRKWLVVRVGSIGLLLAMTISD